LVDLDGERSVEEPEPVALGLGETVGEPAGEVRVLGGEGGGGPGGEVA